MKISRTYPPHYEMIERAFPHSKEMRAVFCWGDTIYSPFSKEEVRPDLIEHEKVHSQQQGDNPFAWWYQYINDRKFRLGQEIAAYGAQVRYIMDVTKGEPESAKLVEYCLDESAKNLSSQLYGGLLTHNEARCKIRNFARSLASSVGGRA